MFKEKIMRKPILCYKSSKILSMIVLAILFLSQSIWSMAMGLPPDEVAPTPTPETEVYKVFIPPWYETRAEPEPSTGFLARFPAEWRPFLRRYGTPILLILAVIAWIGLQQLRKRSLQQE